MGKYANKIKYYRKCSYCDEKAEYQEKTWHKIKRFACNNHLSQMIDDIDNALLAENDDYSEADYQTWLRIF